MTQTTAAAVDRFDSAQLLAAALNPAMIDGLLKQAKSSGVSIDAPDGLLNQLTKAVLERALETEMTDHLGYDVGDPEGACHDFCVRVSSLSYESSLSHAEASREVPDQSIQSHVPAIRAGAGFTSTLRRDVTDAEI